MNHSFSEKEFFLEIFRGKTLCFSLISYDGTNTLPAFIQCLQDLAKADIRSVLFVDGSDSKRRELAFSALRDHDIHCNHLQLDAPPNLPPDLWKKKNGIFPMVIEARNSSTFLDRIITLSLSWRISRMMLIDEHGGFKDEHGNLLSFINFQKLSELTTHSEGYFHPLQEKILKATFTLLSHGVGAIGLCRMADLHRELFTYEGNGTFFSCRHYCEVRELSWDDFPRVAALIHQGVKEGYLLPRSEEQISKILLNGFGAFISGQHLAGVCGLFTEGYEKEKAGEVVALYALTRFQGEGIGARLIQQLKEESEKKGLNILFACTQQTKVMEFFQRQNFVPVEASAIPSAKWRSYDMERKKSAHCFIYDLKGN